MHLRKAAEDVSVLKMRCSINADTMTKAELHQKRNRIPRYWERKSEKRFERLLKNGRENVKPVNSERMKICRLRFKYRKLFYLMSSIR